MSHLQKLGLNLIELLASVSVWIKMINEPAIMLAMQVLFLVSLHFIAEINPYSFLFIISCMLLERTIL